MIIFKLNQAIKFWHKLLSIFISSFVNYQIILYPIIFWDLKITDYNIWRRFLAPSGTITSVDLNTRYQTSSKKLRIVLAKRETKVHSIVFFSPIKITLLRHKTNESDMNFVCKCRWKMTIFKYLYSMIKKQKCPWCQENQ